MIPCWDAPDFDRRRCILIRCRIHTPLIKLLGLPSHPPQLWQARLKKRVRIFSKIAALTRPKLFRLVGDVAI